MFNCGFVLQGIKRVYDKASVSDGKRVLVDRLWPRGVKKSTANIDIWLKDVAPSNELRKWFNHDPERWEEFKKRYKREIDGTRALEALKKLADESDVTLIYASKEEVHNNAQVLGELLQQ